MMIRSVLVDVRFLENLFHFNFSSAKTKFLISSLPRPLMALTIHIEALLLDFELLLIFNFVCYLLILTFVSYNGTIPHDPP